MVPKAEGSGSAAGVEPVGGGRPAKLLGTERRTQLLVAAQGVFVANGYHDAAMDDIARAAYVSKPVLYQHFSSKRELYLALLDFHLTALTDLLTGALDSTAEDKERVRAVIRAYYGFIASDDRAHRLIFQSGLYNDPEVSSRLETFIKGLAEAIAKAIGGDTGLPIEEAELLGRALAGLAYVSACYWLETSAQLDLELASDLIYRLAWGGISRFPSERES